MARTTDFHYNTRGPTEIRKFLGGAADTLYKGAILVIGTDGYVAVPSDGASLIPWGVCKKQVVEDGTHLVVEIERGVIGVQKRTQQVCTIVFVDLGTSNADASGAYFDLYDGTNGYRIWMDVDNGSTPPAAGGLTLVEVDIASTDTEAEAAGKWKLVVDALSFTCTVATATLVVTSSTKGYCPAPSKSMFDVTCTLVETRAGRAIQSDIGELFFAIADDGVVYSGEKSTITSPAGICWGFDSVGVFGTEADILYVDFRLKALS